MGSQTRTFVTAIFFTALAIAFAYVMPVAINRAARSPFFGLDQGSTPLVQTTPAADQAVHLEEPPPGAHGLAVRAAAQCTVKGEAHGRLVRSVARDRQATEESAQAACEKALEGQSDRQGQSRGPQDDRAPRSGRGGTDEARPPTSEDSAGKAPPGGSNPGDDPSSDPGSGGEPSPEPTPSDPGSGDPGNEPSENGNGNGNSGGNGNGNSGGNGNGNGNGSRA